jgi:hypothetical protein
MRQELVVFLFNSGKTTTSSMGLDLEDCIPAGVFNQGLNLLKLGVGILCHGWMGFYLDL